MRSSSVTAGVAGAMGADSLEAAPVEMVTSAGAVGAVVLSIPEAYPDLGEEYLSECVAGGRPPERNGES